MQTTLANENVSMSREVSRDLTLAMISLAVGAISFGATWWTLGLSIVFPVLLFRSETRLGAFSIAFFYHIGASKALSIAAGNFLANDTSLGLFLWAIGNVLNAGVYALLWHSKPTLRIFTIPLAICVLALPPFGTLGWGNPLISAGVIFPGSGFIGFGYLLGLYLALSLRQKALSKAFALLSLWCFITAPKLSPSPIAAISTTFHKTDDNGRGDYERQLKLKARVSELKQRVVLLPEGVVKGGWTEAGEGLWKGEKKTVLIGADDFTARPKNIMTSVHGDIQYVQRQPIPFSMWKPFDSASYASHWFENSVIDARGLKIAPLICYEGFLVWPIAHSYLSGAKYIAASGNYWWAKESEIPSIHKSILTAWSRLFSMPYSLAVNL